MEKFTSPSVSALPQIDNLPKLVHNNDGLKSKILKIPLKQDKST